MRFGRARLGAVEHLLWSRDSRLVSRISQLLPNARIIELANSGWCVLGDAIELTQEAVLPLAHTAAYGLAEVDPMMPASTPNFR